MNPTMDQGLPQQQTATSPPRWPYFINSRSVIMSTTGNRSRPLLFLTFINDLPEVTNSEARFFADDFLLYRPISSRKDTEDLQQDLAAQKNV